MTCEGVVGRRAAGERMGPLGMGMGRKVWKREGRWRRVGGRVEVGVEPSVMCVLCRL